MRRWHLHFIAICGGILAVYAAGAVGSLGNQDMSGTLGVVLHYIDLTSACWALAGFFLLVPAIWAEQRRGRHRRRVEWGTLLAYLVVGLVLACALPLASVTQKLHLNWLTDVLQWAYGIRMPVFGALLVGAGIAHAFGSQSR